ncbi:MAG: hypothetical protein IJH80_02930 [Ruminococcus sp.]|nr:hypothetical protein [Ruminococcus sp.]MBQ7070769.1 hypothetical protein [Ruminococcus sp.]
MAVKKTEEKAAAVKAAAEKKVEEVKATAKKAAAATKTKAAAAKTTAKAKAETAKKTVKKAAAKKAPAKKAAAKDEIFVQLEGVADVSVAAVVEAAKADYKAKTGKAAKAVTVYVKPAEGVAYYTVAGKGGEDFKVEL